MPTYADLQAEAVWRTQVADRLHAGAVVDDAGCWRWPYGLQRNGYGRISVRGVRRLVHRVAYELWAGPLIADRDIDHLCRVRNCINPDHLELVTHQENMLRGDTLAARNAAATHCPQGHAYDVANTYRRPGGGGRDCRRCKQEATARWFKRRREQAA